MAELSARTITTDRLTINVWSGGDADGRTPILMIHGNLTTGGFWRYVAAELPDGVHVIAPDMRGFGDTEQMPIDATRGLGDMVDDVRGLLEHLGLADTGAVHAVGWSMGGGIAQQYHLAYPGDFASITLVAPLSPYGFGGTKGTDGQACTPDFAGAGGGGANADFVRRLAAGDDTSDEPLSAPREILRTFFGCGDNADNVDEDFLVSELLKTAVGDDYYPGDATASEHWPGFAPGNRGVLNTMAPGKFDASPLATFTDGIPITWVRGTADQIVSDRSMFDLATLGELGAVPGWPGADLMPPQPMEAQMRAVLERYAANGGAFAEVALDGVGHGIPLEAPTALAEAIAKHLPG